MNKKVSKSNYINRSSIRSFCDSEIEESAELFPITRTLRAREAVKKAQEIVIKNNAMVDELRKISGMIQLQNELNN